MLTGNENSWNAWIALGCAWPRRGNSWRERTVNDEESGSHWPARPRFSACCQMLWSVAVADGQTRQLAAGELTAVATKEAVRRYLWRHSVPVRRARERPPDSHTFRRGCGPDCGVGGRHQER